jgi:hypothetical protein
LIHVTYPRPFLGCVLSKFSIYEASALRSASRSLHRTAEADPCAAIAFVTTGSARWRDAIASHLTGMAGVASPKEAVCALGRNITGYIFSTRAVSDTLCDLRTLLHHWSSSSYNTYLRPSCSAHRENFCHTRSFPSYKVHTEEVSPPPRWHSCCLSQPASDAHE